MFNYKEYYLDLTEGDLSDSWQSIEGSIYDTNFYWQGEPEKPSFAVYE